MFDHYWSVDVFINKKLLKTMKSRVLCSIFLKMRCPATNKVTAFAELLLCTFFNHCKLSFKRFTPIRFDLCLVVRIGTAIFAVLEEFILLQYEGCHAHLILKNGEKQGIYRFLDLF